MISFRCSSLDRILSCNGSITVAPLFPSTDSAEATEGSVLHWLIAARAVSELGASEPEGGLIAPKTPKDWKLPAFSAWIVDWGVRLLQEEIPQDWALMVEEEFAYEYVLPKPVWLDDPKAEGGRVLVSVFQLTGHIDFLAISPDGKRAIAGDYKTGQVGADPADCNWQASGYLALLKRAYPDLEQADFIMAQPRIDEESTGIPRVSRVSLTGAQLDALNATLAREIGKAMANSMETDSGPKQCRWCPVALNRPWLCPSLRAEQSMKATLTTQDIEAMKQAPDDAKLVSWVVTGRTLAAPQEAAEELLHTRLDAAGYVDGPGIRVTRKITKGSYEVLEPEKFFATAQEVLADQNRMARSFKPSMTALKDEIADAKGVPKTSKKGTSADGIFEERFRPLVKQGERKTLVIQQL